MVLPSGLNKFSSTSEFGPLPTINQIKSFWSRYRASVRLQSQRRGLTHEEVEEENEYMAAALDDDGTNNNGNNLDEPADLAAESDAGLADKPLLVKDMDQKATKNVANTKKKSGPVFVVDGNFDCDISAVTELIVKCDGTVQKNLSKNVGMISDIFHLHHQSQVVT